MGFYLFLGLVFKKRILDLDLDADLNQILFLKYFFDNEGVTVILCVKIAIVITIRYIFDRMRCYEKIRGIRRFRLYILLDMT